MKEWVVVKFELGAEINVCLSSHKVHINILEQMFLEK